MSNPCQINGRPVILLDTPGFDDTNRPDADILTEISLFFAGLYVGLQHCSLPITLTGTPLACVLRYKRKQELLGIIYLHPINAPRMGGTAVRNLQMFHQLVGDATMRNTVIFITKWELVDLEVGKARVQELRTDPLFFKPYLDLQASMVNYAGQNTRGSAKEVITRMVKRNPPVTLQIQVELVDKGLAVSETSAGKILSRDLTERLQKAEEEHQKRMEGLKAQQDRQQGTALMDMQAMLERNYREKVAELESRQRVMQVNVESLGLSRTVKQFLNAVHHVFSLLGATVDRTNY
jgi:hypothetical protein